jgi:AcrR family transcriptional regulator
MSARPARLSRDTILDAAREAIVAGGVDEFSLRQLATRLGVTAPSLYRFFDSKDAIVAAIADAAFAQLIGAIEAAAARDDDPVEQIKAQSRAYVECAVANPALFEVMFAYRPPWADGPALPELPLAQGRIGETDPVLAALTVWSAVHGVATLLTAGGSATPAPFDRALVTSVIDAVVDGLATREPYA